MGRLKLSTEESNAVTNDQTSSKPEKRNVDQREQRERRQRSRRRRRDDMSSHASISCPTTSLTRRRIVGAGHWLLRGSWRWCWHRYRIIVVSIVQIIIQWLVITLLVCSLLRSIARGLCILRLLLVLPTLEFGLLKEPSLLCQSSALFAIFDLVLADQSMWRLAKDRLVFTELADPDVLGRRRVLDVGVFLLQSSLSCC